MSTVSHTPGPWKVAANGGGVTYIESEDGYVAEATNRCDGVDNIKRILERDANARLIAAAPDLLLALETVRQFLPTHGTLAEERINMVESALMKAKGPQ